MEKSRYSLSPAWHVLAALVLAVTLGGPFADLILPRASTLQAAGHTAVARYYVALGDAFWVIALIVFLPPTHNSSGFTIIRSLGRWPLLIRYFVALTLGWVLMGIGILFERFAA
jgi:hypothetical protein